MALSQATLDREPLFIDLETRSPADLPKVGGWNYAADPATHLLTVAWSPAEGEYHVWYPWHTIREDYQNAQATKVTVHSGNDVPEALANETYRPWCAHNAWNFDSLVWRAVLGDAYEPVEWIDTEPLARAAGLPGGLDAIGKRLWGEGKYKAAKSVLKKHMHGIRYGDAADVPAGVMPLLAEYNVQDVFLLRGVWKEITRWVKLPQTEWDVLNAHRDINHRGAAIDQDLLVALLDLTEEGKVHAVKGIKELTKGHKVKLETINDLQSRTKMFAWLDSIGITAFGTKDNGSLRRELISQYIDAHAATEEDAADEPTIVDESEDADAGPAPDPAAAREQSARAAVAVRVLQLRGAALRITGGKLAAASGAVCGDGRVRGLFVYAGAHTFRWAGRRVQVQNLPRPKDGLGAEQLPDGSWRFPLWEMIEKHDRRKKAHERTLDYATVDAMLPDKSVARFARLTPDDAASAMIRMLFIPEGREDVPGKQPVVPPPWSEQDDPLGLLFADLSNIEARVLAACAGEEWLVRAFWDGADPYIPMAEAVFGKRETWPGYTPKTVKKHPYRQVGKIIELGSGYQLGGTQMDIYAAANGIDLAANDTDGPTCVLAYRTTHPAIAGQIAGEYQGRPYFRDGYWHRLNDAAMNACRNPGVDYVVGAALKVTFVKEGPHLMCYLPSGRRLIYRNAAVEKTKPKYLIGSDKYVDAVVYTSPRFGRVPMYGGKWAENVVQAISRDYLANAIVRLERAGFRVPLHVHDEAGGVGRLSDTGRFMSEFTSLPDWSPDFPLDAEGGWLPRYSKSAPPGEKYKETVWRNGAFLKMA